MFYQALAFNQPIGVWNVSSVTNMESMFQYATTFNQNINGWNVSRVTNMEGMFLKAMMFNNGDTAGSSTKSLNNWNVSSVQNMSFMFNQAFSFNQPIGNWNISSVTTMYAMFFAASLFDQDISSWTIPSNLIDMSFMFEIANSFNQDISSWNVENVTKMRGMFTNAYQFNQNIGGWTVNKVDDMREMFSAGITFQRPFGNVVRDVQTIYKNPLGSESWGGFGASPKEINYPLKFTNAGTITFKAYTSTNVNIKFRLEKNTFPNEIRSQDLTSDPSETYNGLTGDIYETNEITISPGTTSYSVTIPAQGDKEFRNVMLYVVTQDVPVTINGVTINNDTASNKMSFNQDIRTWDPPTDVALDYMFTSSSAMISKFTGFTGFDETPTIDFFNITPPAFTSDAPTSATPGELYSYTILTTNASIVEATTKPDWLSFNQETNVLSGTPGQGNGGSHVVVLTAHGGTLSTTQSFTITVNANAPTITSSAIFSALENQTAIGKVEASDADGNNLTYSISGTEIVISSTGVLTFVTAPDYETKNTYTAIVTVSDGTNSDTQDITVNVTSENEELPIFTSSAIFTILENQREIGTVKATDGDNDSLTYFVDGTELEINMISGVLTFKNTPNYKVKSTYNAKVSVSDGVNVVTQDITVNIKPRIDESTPLPSDARIGYMLKKNVQVNTSEGESASVSVSGPEWLRFPPSSYNTITTTNYLLSGIPSESDAGNNNFVITVTVGNLTTTKSFTVFVSKNVPPVFTSTPITEARQESLYSYKVATSDGNNDVVTVTATTIPDWLSFNPTTNTLSGIPPRSEWGEKDIILTATDGYVNVNQEFKIMVRKPICFNKGTKILCLKDGKEQYIAIQELREGDQVKTLNHGYKKIIDMRKGRFSLNGLMDMGMYRMKKQGNMIADLEMSGLHCVLVDKDDSKYADDIKRQRGKNNPKFYIDGKFRLKARESHEFQQMEQKEYTIFSFALQEPQQQYGIWANRVLVETTSRKNLEISNMERITDLVKRKNQ